MSTRLRRALPYIKDTCLILCILLISGREQAPPPQLFWDSCLGPLFKARQRREKALEKKIAHATFYSGECLLSCGEQRGLQGKEGQVLEAPVGLNSTGKVGVQDRRPEGSGPSSHWPVPAWPRTLHSSRVGGRGPCREVSHPPQNKERLKGSGANRGHTESQPGASF